ncbi:MAG TPA: FAD-dependent oxidoreductase, partial [Elusimicrobiota bacterium]|nr:FAD-dependent oxidoreductase [Elusimicrobiota bacterium]
MAKRVRSSGPVWTVPAARAGRPRLKADARADVCVIGAGVAGLSVAYLLAKAGRRVIVLDQRDVRAGETGLTTAHLTSALDSGYARLERLHGGDGARLAAQSHEVAIKRIHAIAADEGISCGLETVDGFVFAGPGADAAPLDEELAAGLRAGLSLERVDSPEAPFELGPCLRFPRQAQLDPARYLDGLAAAV